MRKKRLEHISHICDNTKEAVRMPKTTIVIYQHTSGTVPLLKWLDVQDRKVKDKCIAAMGVLGERGYELRRPTVDYLRDGIYELRVRSGHVHNRILYGSVVRILFCYRMDARRRQPCRRRK
jgi:hypothetical protein